MDIILPLCPPEKKLTEKRHRLTKLRDKVFSANLLLTRQLLTVIGIMDSLKNLSETVEPF